MRTAISYLSRTWLIGSLFKAGRVTFSASLYEFAYLVLWSILPFALGALVLYVTTDCLDKSAYDMLLATFRNGELLVFAISLLAPILYMTLHDPEQAQPFPHKLPISTVVALIIVVSASLFALQKASAVKDADFVFFLSVLLTVIALLFRYLAIIYHRLRMPPTNEMELRADQREFVEKFRQRVEPDAVKTDFTQQLRDHIGGAHE